MAGVAYVDASALVKTVIREPESDALINDLDRFSVHASAALARVEVVRAVRRSEPRAVPRAHEALEKLVLIGLTDSLLDEAGLLEPPILRSLDAIHLVAARSLAPQLSAFVTYDDPLARAALALGLPVESPR